MHRKVLWLLLPAIPIGGLARSQSASQPHHHVQAAVIDGAVNPALIPDLTAYRLWLIAVSRSPNPTEIEAKHQAAQLAKIKLQDADLKSAIDILARFRIQYQALVKSYNDDAKAMWAVGGRPDIASFLTQRDQIVQSARDSLRANLSADAWTRLDAHVKSEKKRMKISAQEAGQ